jgi:hypothetical protein
MAAFGLACIKRDLISETTTLAYHVANSQRRKFMRSHAGQKACDDYCAISDRMPACRHVGQDDFQVFRSQRLGLLHSRRPKTSRYVAAQRIF